MVLDKLNINDWSTMAMTDKTGRENVTQMMKARFVREWSRANYVYILGQMQALDIDTLQDLTELKFVGDIELEQVQALRDVVMYGALPNLLKLDLMRCDIDHYRAPVVADLMRVSRSLATLDIRQNRLGDGGLDEGVKALAAGVAASGSLAVLVLTDNDIGDEGAKALAAAVAASDSLAKLDLSYNLISDEGAQALAAAVAASSSLTDCNVRSNEFRLEAAQVLAKVGTEKRVMLYGTKHDQQDIRVYDNRLGPTDAVLFASDVAVSGSLSHLSIISNKIGIEGTKAIAKSVAVSGSLASLAITQSNIGDAGAKALAAVVAGSDSLETLNLGNNNIGDEGAKALAAGVAASRSLTHLYLHSNKIGDAAKQLLRDVVKTRQDFVLRFSLT